MNKNTTTLSLTSHTDFKKELMKNQSFKKMHEEMDTEMQLLKSLIRERIKNNLTQKQLADKIGVAQSALARFESGRINPTLSFFQKVTHGLGMKLVLK